MSEERIQMTGTAIAIRGNEIDTDQIIPARYMKCVTFDGLEKYAFYDERYYEDGKLKEHPFNDSKRQSATVLLANKNFGCGSSREHAPQAIFRFGIKSVIAESFAEIFRGNCTTMGIPAVTISSDNMAELMQMSEENPELKITIDLKEKKVLLDDKDYDLEIPETFRTALLTGKWDSTAALLANKDKIEEKASKIPYMNHFQ